MRTSLTFAPFAASMLALVGGCAMSFDMPAGPDEASDPAPFGAPGRRDGDPGSPDRAGRAGADDRAGPGGEANQGGGEGGDEPEPEPNIDPSPATHPEVVYVLMTGYRGSGFCTGTLVSADVVVTAGHCLQPTFESWSVVAPHAPGRPRVRAAVVEMYDRRWADPGRPDLGALKLVTEIALPTYAELTDVSARIDTQKPTLGAAVVRTDVRPESPLKKTGALPISGAAEIGYTHGLSVPLFSAGGDSGGGMFLIEKGQMTHKLIGVIREPEPDRGIDHLTRIDPGFIQWVNGNGQ